MSKIGNQLKNWPKKEKKKTGRTNSHHNSSAITELVDTKIFCWTGIDFINFMVGFTLDNRPFLHFELIFLHAQHN